MTIALQEKYFERPAQYLGLWEPGDWRLKIYGIPYRREQVRPELVSAAKELAASVLPEPAVTDARYGVGVLGIHDGRGGVYTFVDWWENENEMHHHLWGGPSPDELVYLSPTGLHACVFEMQVLVAERQAWIDTVLNNPHGPSLDEYLQRNAI